MVDGHRETWGGGCVSGCLLVLRSLCRHSNDTSEAAGGDRPLESRRGEGNWALMSEDHGTAMWKPSIWCSDAERIVVRSDGVAVGGPIRFHVVRSWCGNRPSNRTSTKRFFA